MRHLFLFSLTFFLFFSVLQAQDMNNEKLDEVIDSISDTIQGANGSWQFLVEGLPILCITDERNNRMRFVAPISEVKEVSEEQLKACMEANFHSALDVRYAIADDILWVAYIHPLRELRTEQAMDAIAQVYNAVLTFGTTYSSTHLVFPKSEPEPKVTKKS